MRRRELLRGAAATAALGAGLRRAEAFTLTEQVALFSGPRGGGLPAGAVGLWYMDQYKTSPRKYVPNAVAPGVSQNLFSAPRRLFASLYWGRTNCTATDGYAAAPDGSMEASRLQITANTDGYITSPFYGGLPSGSYLHRWAIKSNTGSSQTLRMGDVTNSVYATITATTSWQVFTNIHTNPPSIPQFGLRTLSASGPALDILVCDAGLYAGTVDLGPDVLCGNLNLGSNSNGYQGVQPAYSNGALTFGNNCITIAQFPSAITPASYTAIVIAEKTVNSGTLSWGLSNVTGGGAYTELGVALENSGPEVDFNGSRINANPPITTSSMWRFYGVGWSAIGGRYDAGAGRADLWLDDIKLQGKNAAISPPVVEELAVGSLWNGGGSFAFGNWTIAAVALWPRALSDTEYRSAFQLLAARAASSGNNVTNKRIYVAEGDSITVTPSGTTGYPSGIAFSPVVQGLNNAVSGSQISDLNNRAAVLDSIIPPNRNGRKFILSVLIGHNDYAGGASPSTYLSNLEAYFQARKAKGWTIVACTQTPSTASGYSAWRASVDPTIASWVGTCCDALCDFAADPVMGPDSAASNTSLYSDGTHPTATGATNLAAIMQPVVNAL